MEPNTRFLTAYLRTDGSFLYALSLMFIDRDNHDRFTNLFALTSIVLKYLACYSGYMNQQNNIHVSPRKREESLISAGNFNNVYIFVYIITYPCPIK